MSYCLAQKDFFISREVIAPNKLLFYLVLNALEQTGAQADGGGVHRGKTLADERRNVFQHVLIVCCDETGEVEHKQCLVVRLKVVVLRHTEEGADARTS